MTTTLIAQPSSMSLLRPKILASELVKLVSLRTTWITALITAAGCISAATLLAPQVGKAIADHDPALAPGVVPETVGLEWIAMGLIGVLIIGVTTGSSEYVSGQLKTSLLAVPSRLTLVLVKALALFIVTLVLAVVTIPSLSLLSQVAIGPVGVIHDGIPASLVWRWIGGIAYWVVMAQIGYALGILFKQSLIPLFGLIIISQIMLVILYFAPFLKYLPTGAGPQLYDPSQVQHAAVLGTPVAAITLGMWGVILLAIAIVRFCKRDAQS